MSRQGLNCTLSYLVGSRRRAYKVRANVVTHGMKVIYDESQARVRKAFYPHRLSSAQFMVNVQLIGEDEYVSFASWMAGYADYVLDLNLRSGEFPAMAVSVPSRDFARKGVPLTGFEWGDNVGLMVREIPIMFETAGEPGEKPPGLSKVGGIALYGNESRYFYPNGIQLSGEQTPPDGTYAKVTTIEDILPPAPSNTGAYDPTGTQRRAGGTTAD